MEDIYLPFKPKKQTRASKAKAKGLEPLAALLMRQENGDIVVKAARFVKVRYRIQKRLYREPGIS